MIFRVLLQDFEFFAGFPMNSVRVPVRRVLKYWPPRLWEPVGKAQRLETRLNLNGFSLPKNRIFSSKMNMTGLEIFSKQILFSLESI